MIPVNTPDFSGNEARYLKECIDTGWISSEGPFVKKFEEQFARCVQRKHGISVCNGTAALELAVSALGIGSGDEVILPSFTIISCAAAVVRAGAIPVVVDCDPVTWNMDVNQIETKITRKTKAIMVVHIYGLPVDMEPVLKLAQRYNLKIIEDAAQAHGLSYKNRPCGSFGDISTFSFYPNKLITTGEGGMVLTDDDTLGERCRSLRNLCFNARRRFIHEELGWNFRMSNLQAAVGLAQLERISDAIVKKRHIGNQYTERLKGIPGLSLPPAKTDYAENIYWVYGIVLDHEISFDADAAMRYLAKNQIGTRPFFWPIHQQPVFNKMGLFSDTLCPVSENIARRGFYIPSGTGLTDEQIDQVAAAIRDMMMHVET